MMVLIADDELRLRKVVSIFLRKNGCDVIEASSGEQAIELIANKRPDIVVLDVQMPGVGGLETCRQIKSNADTKEIPVILLTANASADDRERGGQAGANGYVTKPFSPKELYETMVSIVAK